MNAFKAKLPNAPLENYLPSYTGGADVNKACKYIRRGFTHANHARLLMYDYIIDSDILDVSHSRLVFAAVRDAILRDALRESELV